MLNNLGYELDLLPGGNGEKSGDAILLRCGDLNKGKSSLCVIVIDGGYKCTAENIKSQLQKYYNCINDSGRLQIDLMILSHPDTDHVSGLVELAKDPDIQINNILMHRPWEEIGVTWFQDGRITKHSLKERLADAFEKAYELDQATRNATKLSPAPTTYTCCGAKLHILAPSTNLYKTCIAKCEKTPTSIFESTVKKGISFSKITNEENYSEGDRINWYYDEQTSEINESSFVILFEYEGDQILLTGDAGKKGLKEAIEYANANGLDLSKVGIIKMPHHGSRKNITPEIMDKLGASGSSCYISCVKNDEGHHPSKRLVNMLNQKGFKVYATQGSILHYGRNAPTREGYITVYPKDNYSRMETK